MSQHRYCTAHEGKPVSVLMGWDRPTQVFFMVVERLETGDDDDDQFLYSNLSDVALVRKPGLGRDLAYFQTKLSELHLAVPALMFREIRMDAALNVGNRYVTYDENGSMTEGSIG